MPSATDGKTSPQTLDESQSKLMNERNGGFLNRGTPHQFHGRIVHVNHPAISGIPPKTKVSDSQAWWWRCVAAQEPLWDLQAVWMLGSGFKNHGPLVKLSLTPGCQVANCLLKVTETWYDMMFCFSWNIDIIYYTYVIYMFIHAGIYVMYVSKNSARLLMQSTLLCGCAVFLFFWPMDLHTVYNTYIHNTYIKKMYEQYIYIVDICIELYLHTHICNVCM